MISFQSICKFFKYLLHDLCVLSVCVCGKGVGVISLHLACPITFNKYLILAIHFLHYLDREEV